MKTMFAWIPACALFACSESNRCASAPDAQNPGPDAAAVVADAPTLDGGGSPDQPAPGSAEAGALNPGGLGCIAAPASAPQAPGSRDPDVLARAATVVGSCMGDDGINRRLTSMWNVWANPAIASGREVLQADCLVRARCGCGALEACLGFTSSPVDPGCVTGCAGSVFTMCATGDDGQGYRASIDCSTEGLVCDPLAICQESLTVACDPATFTASCGVEGRSEICRSKGAGNAIFRGPVCERLGLLCSEGVCVGQGAACSGGEPGPEGQINFAGSGCAGTSLVACVGGRVATFDCTRIAPGFSCQAVSGTYFCGLASECVPGNIPYGRSVTANSCEGSSVVLCNAGRIDRVDCLSLGFAGCEVDRSRGKLGCVPGAAYPVD